MSHIDPEKLIVNSKFEIQEQKIEILNMDNTRILLLAINKDS